MIAEVFSSYESMAWCKYRWSPRGTGDGLVLRLLGDEDSWSAGEGSERLKQRSGDENWHQSLRSRRNIAFFNGQDQAFSFNGWLFNRSQDP